MARKSPLSAAASRVVSGLAKKVRYTLRPEEDPYNIEEQVRADKPSGAGGKWASVTIFPAPITRRYRRKTKAEVQADLEEFGEQFSPKRYQEYEYRRNRAMERQRKAKRRAREVV